MTCRYLSFYHVPYMINDSIKRRYDLAIKSTNSSIRDLKIWSLTKFLPMLVFVCNFCKGSTLFHFLHMFKNMSIRKFFQNITFPHIVYLPCLTYNVILSGKTLKKKFFFLSYFKVISNRFKLLTDCWIFFYRIWSLQGCICDRFFEELYKLWRARLTHVLPNAKDIYCINRFHLIRHFRPPVTISNSSLWQLYLVLIVWSTVYIFFN